MKTAFFGAFLLSALSLPGDQLAGTGPVEEWPQARWGMTEPEVLRAFDGAVKKLPSPQSSPEFIGRLGTLGIDDVAVGGVELQALFLFDHAGRLDAIRLTSPDSTSPTDEQFRKIEDSLIRKYREPLRAAGKERFLSVWTLPRSVIELDYFRPKSITITFENKIGRTQETLTQGLTVIQGKHPLERPLTVPAWLVPFPHQNEKYEPPSSDHVRMSYDADAAFAVVNGHYETVLHKVAGSGITFTEGGNARGAGAIFEISVANSHLGCTVEVSPAMSTHVVVECLSSHQPDNGGTLAARAPQVQTRAPVAAVGPTKDWALVSVESRVTESNSVWSRFAWKLKLRNDSPAPHLFQAKIEFQDRDGFIVDTNDAYNLLVPGQSEQEFTGFALIKAEVVGSVSRAAAKVNRTR